MHMYNRLQLLGRMFIRANCFGGRGISANREREFIITFRGKSVRSNCSPPHPTARTSCAALNVPDSACPPPAPTGLQELRLLPWLRKWPQALAPAPCPVPDPGATPGCRGVTVPQFPHSPRPALHAHTTVLAPCSVAPSVIPAWRWPHRCRL